MGCGLRAALGSSGACLHRGADPSSGSALQPVHLLQCPLLSLWASFLQDHPPLYWPLRFVGWGEPSGSIKTSWLTHSHGQWCLGKDFRGSSWDHLSAWLALMLPTHQELDPKQGLLCFSV